MISAGGPDPLEYSTSLRLDCPSEMLSQPRLHEPFSFLPHVHSHVVTPRRQNHTHDTAMGVSGSFFPAEISPGCTEILHEPFQHELQSVLRNGRAVPRMDIRFLLVVA